MALLWALGGLFQVVFLQVQVPEKKKKKKIQNPHDHICSVGRQLVSVAFYPISLSSIIGKQGIFYCGRKGKEKEKQSI